MADIGNQKKTRQNNGNNHEPFVQCIFFQTDRYITSDQQDEDDHIYDRIGFRKKVLVKTEIYINFYSRQ